DDPILRRRAVAPRPLEQPEPGDRGGQRATRGAAEADDLESLLNAAPEQRLERSRNERTLTSPALTGDRDPLAGHRWFLLDGPGAHAPTRFRSPVAHRDWMCGRRVPLSMNAGLRHCLVAPLRDPVWQLIEVTERVVGRCGTPCRRSCSARH